MASINFNGKEFYQPQAYAITDTSDLVGVGVAAGGIIGLIGTAEGGEPNVVTRYTSPATVQNTLKGGNLLHAMVNAYNEGAQVIYAMRIGNASHSALTLQNSSSGDVVTLTSKDWGEDQNNIAIKVEDGTTSGKKVTLRYIDSRKNRTSYESWDNINNVSSLVNAINNGVDTEEPRSNYITATSISSGDSPVNIIYTNMIDGDNGSTITTNDVQDALDTFLEENINLIGLAGIADAASHALLSSHVTIASNSMKPRIAVVGGEANEVVGNTSTGIVKRAYDLNSDRMVLVAPGLTDANYGAETPAFVASKVLGALASVDAATSITHRNLKSSGIEKKFKSSEKDILVTKGVTVIEEAPSGRRIMRGVTTIQDISQTVEDPFKEISIRRIADFINVNMTANLEALYIGKKGVAGIENSIATSVNSILSTLVDNQIIVSFDAISVEKDPNNPKVFLINYKVVPINPINFIFITTRLVNSLT